MDKLSHTLITMKTLLKKLKVASNEVESMEVPFEGLSSVLDANKLKLWTQEAEKADNEREEALDIYSVQMDKSCLSFFFEELLLIIFSLNS